MNSKKLKILFLQPYPTGEAAGQRFKVEQAYNILRESGHEVTVNSFFDIQTWKILYKKGFLVKKSFNILFLWINRLFFLLGVPRYDVVYVFMWVTPRGYPISEWLVRKLAKRLIVDVDDEVYKTNDLNLVSSLLSCKPKSKYLVQYGDIVFHNSPQSAIECRKLNVYSNVIHMPCSFDMQKYKPKTHIKKDYLTLGWTGTFSSAVYLKSIEPILKDIYSVKKFKLKLITNFQYSIEGIDVEVIPWRHESEISDLSDFDIGIYPVLFDDWSKSKGGLKVQQYMSMGIPSVSTNHGAATYYVDHYKTGFLANNDIEWKKYILQLMDDEDLRESMGKLARKVAEQNFSTDVSIRDYFKIFTEF
jgi:glycosyltransferase involved in cell wall biosynthesis